MATIDLPVPRSYKAEDLKFFSTTTDKDVFIDRILISQVNKTHPDAEIRKPTRLGFYSLKLNKKTGKRVYFPDKSQLRYLNVKQGHQYDLKVGYNPNIRWGQDLVGLDEFLQWILENRTKFMIDKKQLPTIYNLNTDFVCFRGVITKLMLTPYERNEDWMLIAIKIGDTIYFHQLATEAKTELNRNGSEHHNLLSYCGHSFEDMVCREMDGLGNMPSKLDSGDTGQFCCVLRSRLKSHSLVYAAEMDCIEKANQFTHPFDKLKFIEVKTTATIYSARQRDNFNRFKSIKWWTQSHLSGIETILCGYRESDQTVHKTELISLNKLAADRLNWSPHVCFNFLDSFLTFTKQCITQEKIVYRIECKPSFDVTFTQTQLPIESFIPRWYLDQSPPQPLI